MYDILSDTVFRVKCGDINGTAFLINKSIAITAFHVVKKYDTNKIELMIGEEVLSNAILHESINEDYKKKDIALLSLEKDILIAKYLSFASVEKITAGSEWLSRGFPRCKQYTGENIIKGSNYTVNQQLDSLKNCKIDIELNHGLKWESYEGMSGAPLIINEIVVGVINTELTESGTSKEMSAISVKNFSDLLVENGVVFKDFRDINSETSIDVFGASKFVELKSDDIRNIADKLKSVCSEIKRYRVNKYCRDLASGKAEMSMYSDQEISATKYRVYEKCQDELMDFVEENNSENLTIKEINGLIERFINKAEEIIVDKSKQYKYPFKTRDLLRVVVLDLINECFLSFDKEGIYE